VKDFCTEEKFLSTLGVLEKGVEEVLKKCPSSLGGKEENKLPKYEVLRG
jgi:hypothetical protein